MRYKQLVTNKLEGLNNALSTLRYKVYQGTTKEDLDQIFIAFKEKIEEIQTLVNSENEQREGSW